MKRVVVLIDPQHEYGAAFIETVFTVWGLQSVCLYTDRRSVFLNAYRYPELQSAAVAGHFMIDGLTQAEIATMLARDFNVAAAIPHVETSVLPAAELAEALGLSWAQPDTLDRFRDKHALKRFIASQPGSPRMNHVCLVSSVADVRAVLAAQDFDRFVLKPNDGFGNTDVGFFDRSSSDAQIAEFLPSDGMGSVLLEEFIAGQEYYVNGQIDGDGNVEIMIVCLSQRIAANGKANVLDEAIKVSRDDSAYTPLVEYVEAVMRTSGLRRSPFHAEVIIDERGPCLVEVGARLVGASGATDMNIVHGGRIDVFQVAAHYYLSAEPFGHVNLDWAHYDSVAYTTVYGTSYQSGLIWRIDGIAEVEAMPEFVRWMIKPEIGQEIMPTTDMFSIAYMCNLEADSPAALRAAVAKVRRILVFNRGATEDVGFGHRMKARTAVAAKAARALPRALLVRPSRLAGHRAARD